MKSLKVINFKPRNYRKTFLGIFVLTLLTALLILATTYNYSKNIQQGLSENLIRLHVIANSDCVDDQEVKLKVRNEILKYMQAKSIALNSTNEAKNIIYSNLNYIEGIAKKTLTANGCNYEAKVLFGEFPFPTKVYGDVILPAGTYQSLRVVLGDGKGGNWWCVMFPPLCFVDASKGVVPDSSKAQLQNILTEEEYNVIMSSNKYSASQFKIKFKVVEIFQESKMKLASLLMK